MVVRLDRGKHSSLLDSFVSFEEDEVFMNTTPASSPLTSASIPARTRGAPLGTCACSPGPRARARTSCPSGNGFLVIFPITKLLF